MSSVSRYALRSICAVTAALWMGNATADPLKAPQYLDGTVHVHLRADDGQKAIGKAMVATPIQVISEQGDWLEISMAGWTQAGAERVIYAAPGIRVLRAAMSKSAVDQMVFGESVEDGETGLVWTRTEVRGWVKAPSMQPSLADIWMRAEPLFSDRCTACHQRRVPKHYTANQWNSHLKVMGPRTGLPKEDQFLIRAFLQYHAQDSDKLEAIH